MKAILPIISLFAFGCISQSQLDAKTVEANLAKERSQIFETKLIETNNKLHITGQALESCEDKYNKSLMDVQALSKLLQEKEQKEKDGGIVIVPGDKPKFFIKTSIGSVSSAGISSEASLPFEKVDLLLPPTNWQCYVSKTIEDTFSQNSKYSGETYYIKFVNCVYKNSSIKNKIISSTNALCSQGYKDDKPFRIEDYSYFSIYEDNKRFEFEIRCTY